MSVGGLSGAFLLLPFQVSILGFTGPGVTPTNHLYNVVAIPSGVYRYFREGRMLWPLATIISVGTIPGVIIGSLVRVYLLPDPVHFKLFAGFVLVLIGSQLFHKLLKRSPAREASSVSPPMSAVQVRRFDWRRLEYTFRGETHRVPVVPLTSLTVIIGVIGGAYGIGGGAIIAPVLVSLWRLPVHTIAGATLFGTFLTSATGVVFFWLMGVLGGMPNVAPNWMLGISFGLGGFCGTYCGARLQRFIPERPIEWLLGLVVTGLGLSYIAAFWLR
jgi:uncharacterized membrane protein YfcA